MGAPGEPYVNEASVIASSGRVEIVETSDALASRVAEWFAETTSAISGPLRVALSGGSTPRALYQILGSDAFCARVPWHRLSLFFGDERMVPYDHPDSNYRMVRETLLRNRPLRDDQIFPIPTDSSPDEAAQAYEQTLRRVHGDGPSDSSRPLFDIVFLGLGNDGHTASLLPGQPVLRVTDRWVAPVPAGRAEVRITLTYPAIESSGTVAFLVTGADKAKTVSAVLQGDQTLPAARIATCGTIVWFLDRAAASEASPSPNG
jgi:6-phosphogluconolactonase